MYVRVKEPDYDESTMKIQHFKPKGNMNCEILGVFLDYWHLKKDPTGCTEASVTKCEPTPRKMLWVWKVNMNYV